MEAALLDLLQQAKEAGTKASLSFTTVGGKISYENFSKLEMVADSDGPHEGPSLSGVCLS